MPGILAGAIYFAAVFAVSFLFGIVRQLVLVPRLGEFYGVVIEAPFTVAASFFVARWVIGRLAVARQARHRFVMGLSALALLLSTEATLSWLMRGWTFEQWLAHFATAPGALSLILFLIFAAMPLILLRKPL